MDYGKEFRKYAVHHMGLNGSTVDGYMNHTIENMTRAVIEERPMNFREVDVFSRLMADRIIFMGTAVDDNIANIVVAQLAVPRIGRCQERRADVHQQPRRLGVRRPGYLRHHAVRAARRGYGMHQPGGFDGGGAAGGWRSGQAFGAAPRAGDDPPTFRRGAGYGLRTSRLRPAKLSSFGTNFTKFWPNIPEKTRKDIEKDSDSDKWFRAMEAKEYGLIDEVLTREKSKEK